jgi:hypothetical protein
MLGRRIGYRGRVAVAPETSSSSTLSDGSGARLEDAGSPVAAWARRATLLVLAIIVAASLTGFLGVHTATATSTRDGYTLSLRYPQVARAGLDVEWQATVTHPGGFDKGVTLAITGDYFDIFETQGFHPQPSEETRDANTLYLTFASPPGDTFVVYYDAYIQPASQQGKSARIAVLDHDVPVVWLDYKTHLFP